MTTAKQVTKRRGLTANDSTPIGARVSNALYAELAEIAVAEDVSISDVIRKLLKMGAQSWRRKNGKA